MKTNIQIEINTTGKISVLPEEVFAGLEKWSKEDIAKFQNEWTEDFHETLAKKIKELLQNKIKTFVDEEIFNDTFEDYYIEGYDELKKYKTTIKVK